jgi:hypothetical protein
VTDDSRNLFIRWLCGIYLVVMVLAVMTFAVIDATHAVEQPIPTNGQTLRFEIPMTDETAIASALGPIISNQLARVWQTNEPMVFTNQPVIYNIDPALLQAEFHNIRAKPTDYNLDWTATNIEVSFSHEPYFVGKSTNGEWKVRFR